MKANKDRPKIDSKSNMRTEAIAGITTFFTMVYIVIVNSQILSADGKTGMAFQRGADGDGPGLFHDDHADGLVREAAVCGRAGHGHQRVLYLYDYSGKRGPVADGAGHHFLGWS